MAKTVDLVIRPVLDAVTVRPGDKLVVRMAPNFTREQHDYWRQLLGDKLPGVEVVLLAAEQILVYRPDGADA